MIRRASERVHTSKKMFGAPGELEAFQILNPGEFNDKGRLFNHCVLRPGEGLGMHRHSGDFEIYYIIKGQGLYNDNGTETTVSAGDTTFCMDGEEHSLLNNGTEKLEFIALILFSK